MSSAKKASKLSVSATGWAPAPSTFGDESAIEPKLTICRGRRGEILCDRDANDYEALLAQVASLITASANGMK